MTTADVHMSDEAERERKAAKKAKKAEKKARLAAEAAANGTEAPAASPTSSPSPSPSPSASPVSMDESESNVDEAAAAEAKKKKKAEKKARKAAEAAAAAVAEADSTPASAAPSTSSSSSFKSAKASASPQTPLRKNYYQQHAEIAAMSDSAVEAYRAEHKMTLTGEMYGQEAMYKPVTGFHQCGYSKQMLKCTEGFKAPTGIQAQCWPVLLMGRDAIAIAETGSGKTLGFVLPALVHILDSPPIDKSRKGRSVDNMGPIALVLAPTRELAMQSAEVAEKASQSVGLITACIYGGVEPFKQRAALANGVHMLVCTPGRLLSMIKSNDVSLKRVSFLVLDEADRMLDLGFEPDIRAIIGYCPDSQHRQTLMFSATWPESVKKLASEFIVDPLRITIGKDADEMETDTLAANKRITQTVEVMEDFKKDSRLQQLLAEHTKDGGAKHKKILVFVLYKKEVDRVERTLRQRGFAAVGMSADKTQAERVQALEDFKSGKSRLLVATDVAGRGLDVRDIELVINYTFPLTIADYVHRIGRTGRGGKSGEAITFFTKNEKGLSGELINVLREANQPVPEDLMKFGTGVKRKEHAMYGAFGPKSGDDRPMKKATKVTFD